MTKSPPAPLPSPKERRRLRESASLSQADLATKVGVTRETVRSWETGRTNPRGRKRETYARLLAAIAADQEAGRTAASAPPPEPVRPKPAPPKPGPPKPGPPKPAPPNPAPPNPDPPKPAAVTPTSSRQEPESGPELSPEPESGPESGSEPESGPEPPKPAPPKPAPPKPGPPKPGPPKPMPPGKHSAAARRGPKPAAKRAARSRPAPTRRTPVAVGTLKLADPTPAPRPTEAAAEAPAPSELTPAGAFDALCTRCAPALVRQTYLLTGKRALALESVERAFQLAWQRWPEVAVDRDPAGWVRAAAYEYAMSPWHRFRPGRREQEAPPAEAADRAFLDVLMSLPPAQRRTLLLYDGVGLDLPETAAETEASTPAAAGRLLHARETIAAKLPELSEPEVLHQRLGALGEGERLAAPKAELVRTGSENRARFWTRAAIAFTVVIIGATALTLRTAPNHYEPPQSPGKAISGIPARMGPGHLSQEEKDLHKKLRAELTSGPERLAPKPE
ncbi:helix-turn-helix domain-containing protein [Streptomyces sp. NPDC059009]|uniref:helix-turn-helix domain-containing protein n=1 Tax=Streptomyces sp. NPDC059009 TaxID=3346694 RepID=UPI003690377F